ncbi:hypothetical protein C1646_668501 [Rhizophagus diaphanus]|nr:hypothetical protein C1646_668501 [Rhizophagus diaphanus] [Rhizophagus sp. MUCL 43196]
MRGSFECDPSIAEKIQQENKNLSPTSHRIKGPGFPKVFVKMPSWVKYNKTFTATETYKERYVRLLPNEGDIYVGSLWETGKTYALEHLTISKNVNLQDWAKKISSLPFENWKSASLICHLKKDIQGIVRALKTSFPELRIKEYHGKSNLVEKAHNFSNVEESWKDVDLVAYTSTLKIGVSYTNPKFEQAFCIFNSYIEMNAKMNQMLFYM